MLVSLRSDEMPNLDIKLSHHEKRSLAWKILIVTAIIVVVMVSAGALHAELAITDQTLSVWMMGVAFVSLGMFGLGYVVRDKLPKKMSVKCKRFYFMGHEFGIWHWSRAQVFLADIFLVGFGGAVYGWGAAHSWPLIFSGISALDTVPLLYLPIFYVQFWTEFVVEGGFLLMAIFGFVYEMKTWVTSNRNDFCFFEGIETRSEGMTYDCDPNDPGCSLDRAIP